MSTGQKKLVGPDTSRPHRGQSKVLFYFQGVYSHQTLTVLWFGGQFSLPLHLHHFVQLHSGFGIFHRGVSLPPSLRRQERTSLSFTLTIKTLSQCHRGKGKIDYCTIEIVLPGCHGWRWPWWVSWARHTRALRCRPWCWAEGFETCPWSRQWGESNRGPWSRCGQRVQSPPSHWAASGSADTKEFSWCSKDICTIFPQDYLGSRILPLTPSYLTICNWKTRKLELNSGTEADSSYLS